MNENGKKSIQRNWKKQKVSNETEKSMNSQLKREREFVFICNIRKVRVREAKERN
jgi:hypothetical protein